MMEIYPAPNSPHHQFASHQFDHQFHAASGTGAPPNYYTPSIVPAASASTTHTTPITPTFITNNPGLAPAAPMTTPMTNITGISGGGAGGVGVTGSSSSYSHPYNSPNSFPMSPATTTTTTTTPSGKSPRKRKAETQENERLSKRLSLLNLEKNGNKLYVPVESPQLRPTTTAAAVTGTGNPPPSPISPLPQPSLPPQPSSSSESMHLDDTKHKVYIYDLDDELSSSSSDNESASDPNEHNSSGRLVFLPDIERHLRQNRIPPAVLANRDGELAGHCAEDMQLVLYREAPAALSVPEELDGVRRAVLEARRRLRERRVDDVESEPSTTPAPGSVMSGADDVMVDDDALVGGGAGGGGSVEDDQDHDPDAMEMD